MARDFAHTFTVATGRTAYPLTATVAATFDNDGSLHRWGLALAGLPPLSDANRDRLINRVLPAGGALSGDGIGAEWRDRDHLAIWTEHLNWSLTAKQASKFRDQIHVTLGRFCEEARPPVAAVAPVPGPDDRDARIAILERENRDLKAMVEFLRQYAPR